jgi:hypothetical protein
MPWEHEAGMDAPHPHFSYRLRGQCSAHARQRRLGFRAVNGATNLTPRLDLSVEARAVSLPAKPPR